MSLLQNTPMLEGSRKSDRPLRECSTPGCGPKDPATGIEIGNRWLCASCWRKRNSKKKG